MNTRSTLTAIASAIILITASGCAVTRGQESTGAYIYTWLIGYSALLGPIAGIMLADYYLIRRTELDRDALFRHDGAYAYRGGWNPAALAALIIGSVGWKLWTMRRRAALP